jgi:nucleoside-diphosphate kinase
MSSKIEKTVIILKPDALKRAIVGEIFERFERVGLKLLQAKMIQPNKEVIEKHYPGDEGWIREMGEKTLASFKQSGKDAKAKFGTEDTKHLGQYIYDRLISYWQEGPVIVSVWEAPNAVAVARKLRGHTIPLLAEPGTIFSQYSFESSDSSADLDRAVKTFIHASGSVSEAEREMKYWFGTTEFKSYEREYDQLYLK